VIFRDESASQMIVKRFHKARVSDSKEGESARSNQRQSENGYAALGRLDAMIIGLRYWERLESTMTGGSANRLMVSARRDAITVHAGLSVTLVCSSLSLTKLAMIAVIAPNCLMAGKWMIIVLERHEELPSRHEFFVIRLTDLCTLYARIERERNEIRRLACLSHGSQVSLLAPEFSFIPFISYTNFIVSIIMTAKQ